MKIPFKYLLLGLPVVFGGAYFATKNYFEKKSRQFCLDYHIYTTQETNAVAHCYVSYKLTDHFGVGIARFVGNVNEGVEKLYSKKTENTQKDTWKDQWNNQVGQQIGTWKKEHFPNIPNDCIDQMIVESLKDSTLIFKLTDPRIDLLKPPKALWQGPNSSGSLTKISF